MKFATIFGLALAAVAMFSVAHAAELKSGLQAGQYIGAFDVVKCGGASEDGVDVGDQLCYRCKYGGRPMVIIFSRGVNDNLTALARRLDKAIANHSDEQLAAFVNVLGSDRDEAEAQAQQLASAKNVSKVPVVVPVEFQNGPADYGVSPDAEVTVILATGGKVVANHAFAAGELDQEGVKAVLKDVPKLLN